MDVVVADPPGRQEAYDCAYPNLGVLYLIGFCRSRRPDIKFHYLEADCDEAEHLERIARVSPAVYGISYASLTSPLAHRTIAAVRRRFPNLPIVVGGPHPTAAWKTVLSSTETDVCVIGEGEEVFAEIIEHYAGRGKPLAEIPGIAFREDGKPRRTDRRRPTDIDGLPLPAWDLVEFSKYPGMHLRKADPQTYMLVSRGCPWDCNFCSNPIWKSSKPWCRLRSPESIAREVKGLYERGIREIYLSADEFNVNWRWPLEVARTIYDLGYRDLYFQCNVRADKVNLELAQAFKAMNLWMVHIGIESGNQRTLDGIDKKIRLEDVVAATRTFQRAGVKVFGFMMCYHAWEENGRLRYETPPDVDQSLRFARRLLKDGLLNYMSWQAATPFPGSKLWETAVKYCLIEDQTRFADFRSPAMLLPGVSARDVRRSLRQGYLLKNWYAVRSGNIQWKQVERIRKNVGVMLGLS